jgi:ferritin
MDKEVLDLLNTQIEKEAKASQVYLGLSISVDFKGYSGFAELFRNRTNEERIHLLKLVDYLSERGQLAKTPDISSFNQNYYDVEEYFEVALDLERDTTQGVEEICAKCMSANDFTTLNFMQWFLTEQQEEEALFQGILDKFSILDKNKTGIYLLQQELLDADNTKGEI